MIDLPHWLDADLWQEWIDYRRQDKKKPASERSQKMTIKKLDRLRGEGYSPDRLIEKAIEAEWQGIYAHDECKADVGAGTKLSAVEQFRAASSPRSRLRAVGDTR
jgi:hypothetical protein